MTEEVNKKYDRLLLGLDKNDPICLDWKYYFDSQREQDLDSIKTMEENKKHCGARTAFHDIGKKIEDVSKLETTKRISEFCPEESVSFKSFATKEKQEVHLTTRFLFGKMLMFAKLSLVSFIYELLETFCFPGKKVKKSYEMYSIENVYMYHILTDTGITSLHFLFVSDAASNITESKYREIIFDVICASEI